MATKIYHNPRCSKSRTTLEILREKNEDIEVIDYLKQGPTKADLEEILSHLKITPLQLVRKGENIFKENYKGKEMTDAEWITAMVEHPILIERPIVIKDGKAIIGRPPELVLDIL